VRLYGATGSLLAYRRRAGSVIHLPPSGILEDRIGAGALRSTVILYPRPVRIQAWRFDRQDSDPRRPRMDPGEYISRQGEAAGSSVCMENAPTGIGTQPFAGDGAGETGARRDGDLSTGRRIIRNFASLTGANLLCFATSFATTAYLARTLDAGGFGILGFSQATVGYFLLLTNMGFAHYGVREIARRPAQINRYVDNIFTIKLILAVSAYALLVLFTALIPKPPPVKAVILILGTKIFQSAFNLRWVFQGRERMGWIAMSRIVPQLFYVGGVFLLVRGREQLGLVSGLQAATVAAGALMLFLLYSKRKGIPRLSTDLAFWREIFRQSLPMAASYLLSMVYVNFDMILIGFMRGESDAGHYNVAYKFTHMINLLGVYYFFSLFPNLSRLYYESTGRLKSLLEQSLRHVGMIALPLSVGGTILGGSIVFMIFGEGYAESVLPFQILMWNVVVIWIRQHFSNGLIACNLQNRHLAGAALGAVSNIALNAIFIPRYGIAAAAVTTLFSELLVLSFMYREFRKVVRVDFIKKLSRPALASAAMGALLLVLPEWNVIAKTAAGAFFYFVVLCLVGGIGREDAARIKALLSPRERTGADEMDAGVVSTQEDRG